MTGIYPEGTDLTLLCESSSTSRIKTITWVKNGATVTPNSKQMISSDGKKLMLKKVKFADSGKYACNVTVDGMAAVTSKELKLWGTNHNFYEWKWISHYLFTWEGRVEDWGGSQGFRGNRG